ncbi:MAG: hypothetical protein J5704_03785 [Paludibacteraceae bacterium]|nr:hypothetical protein [Paludibacteraceae bacterium]
MATAKVGAAGIEYIQGAMKRPKVVNGHNHGNYLVMTHRTAETTNPNCQRIYTFDADRYKRSTPVLADELARRTLFKNRAAWVVERSRSLQNVTSDQAAFIAQKDQSGGYKTMKSYLWSLAIAAVPGE